MPSSPVLCLLLCCGGLALLCLQSRRRLIHSEALCRRSLSATETAAGIVVIFTTFLPLGAYALSNLNQFRRQ